MVSKRQLKQVYPLTERAHIMVSTMIWVGLINPPFEVPLGQKGVPLSVSLDHRFTSLGAATAFILWKKGGKKKQRLRDHTVHWSSCAERRRWQFNHRAIRCAGLCKGCAAVPRWRFAQWSLTQGRHVRGHSQLYPTLWTFSAAAAAQVTPLLLPHLETTLLFRPPFIAKWQLLSYISVHKGRMKWHLSSVYSLLFPNMVFEECFGYF